VGTLTIVLTFYAIVFAALLFVVVLMRRVLQRDRAVLRELGELPARAGSRQGTAPVPISAESGPDDRTRKSAA
jgi:hypothetical protein